MDQNNNRYELIIGFVTLILSFSAFKDELKEVVINLGFITFTLSDYLLKIVYGFGICVYLYIIERIARQSKRLNSWKIINYIEKLAFILFVFIVITPFLLIIVFIFYSVFDKFTRIDEEQKASLTAILSLIFGIITGGFSTWATLKVFKDKNRKRQEDIEKEEIFELENAMKLYDKDFYSQSILEAFKVLEIHLIRLLAKRHLIIPRHQFNFNELFNYSIKLELLDKEDIDSVQEIRKMRNTAAHLDVEYTKQQARKVLDFVKYLIQKTSDKDKNHVR